MRLHPVTQIVVFAIALRLTADAIFLADSIHAYVTSSRASDSADWSRVFASNEREFAQTVVYLVDAVMIEGLSRVWSELRNRRQTAGWRKA